MTYFFSIPNFRPKESATGRHVLSEDDAVKDSRSFAMQNTVYVYKNSIDKRAGFLYNDAAKSGSCHIPCGITSSIVTAERGFARPLNCLYTSH